MYTKDEGNFNSEALIVDFKKDSITLAIQMMDDYFFRLEEQKNGTTR
jgi:HIV Tat-specific factor 1